VDWFEVKARPDVTDVCSFTYHPDLEGERGGIGSRCPPIRCTARRLGSDASPAADATVLVGLRWHSRLQSVWGVDDALPRKPIMLKQADGRLGESRFANFQLHVGCRKPEDGSRPWWFSAASLFFGLVLGPRCFRVSATPGRGNGPRDGSLMISRRRTSVALRISRRTAAWQQAFCMHSSGTAAVV
jgi:hypothetical protein